jgi:hypothetical protein
VKVNLWIQLLFVLLLIALIVIFVPGRYFS